MNLRLLASLGLALATFVCARADDYALKEPFTRTSAFSPTGTLVVDNINGNVTVRAWDKNEILIEGVKSAKSREELERIDLTMDVSESRAHLKVKLPKRERSWFGGGTIRAAVRFTIRVPATAVLQSVETVNASVTVDAIRGPVHAETVNGSIDANDLFGDAHLETVNGAIHADFARLAQGQRLSFETVNGQITVRLPEKAGFSLESSVVNGQVDCDFPLQLKQHSRRSINGTVGDGGASVSAETVNGSISIAKR
jgi:hypothetical protein